MPSNNLVSRLALVLAALAAAPATGCAAGAADEPTQTTESALASGGGVTRLGYTCDGALCTCTGDPDCNDMFGSGICGDIAQCDLTGSVPVCRCIKTLGLTRSPVTRAAAPKVGLLK